jgi:methyltransferase-like protein
MAEQYPQCTLVGIDVPGPPLAAARESAAALELANLRFHEMNVADAGEELGTFDYVICCSRWARATPDEQDSLLSLVRARLAPRGVAYIGYPTLPGRLLAPLVRELIHDCQSSGRSMDERIGQSRRALRLADESLGGDPSAYAQCLQSELEQALALDDAAFCDEHLGPAVRAMFFHEFVDRADRHELQYLGDSEISTMFPAVYSESIQRSLAQVSPDAVSLEQHLDLVRNRAFHHSLVCHQGVSISRQLTPASLHGLFLAGNLRREGAADLPSDETARFVAASGLALATALPAVKSALDELARAWPRAIAFGELLETVESRLAASGGKLDQQQHDQLAQNLVNCLMTGLIEARAAPDFFVSVPSQRPRAARWARAEAEASDFVTNRRHEPVVLDEMSRRLLVYLDGQRDRAALHRLLVEAADQGQLSILKSGMPASGDASAATILEQVLDQSLARLAASALLVA